MECLASDAVTAWRMFSLERYAWDGPETSSEALTEGEREVIGLVAPAERPSPTGRSRRTSAAASRC